MKQIRLRQQLLWSLRWRSSVDLGMLFSSPVTNRRPQQRFAWTDKDSHISSRPVSLFERCPHEFPGPSIISASVRPSGRSTIWIRSYCVLRKRRVPFREATVCEVLLDCISKVLDTVETNSGIFAGPFPCCIYTHRVAIQQVKCRRWHWNTDFPSTKTIQAPNGSPTYWNRSPID